MYIHLNSLSETESFAIKVAESLEPGDVISLNGDLGSGKTTFTKMLLAYFGCDDVTSPSYCLQNIYEISSLTIEHWDLYRLSMLPDEILDKSPNIKIVEWGNKLSLPCDLELNFEIIDEKCRKVVIKADSQSHFSSLFNS